ncbi:hypothetical protein E1B28_004700 [Marasmius oreades]|uniref:Uncharacterized protein n=1 Tax=Marasmius oreades TaxID=181124 RepID=A0A9P7UZ53_9AGAR|nr:uncharacterized protein E1B28_004700 [Marasmius oreades]KAG7097344.1 hypothetical protein E1B28_004700 [Marasmius oreades]
MFKLASLVSFVAVATIAVAAPSARDAQCHPNFGGRTVSIVTKEGGMEWGHGTLQVERALTYQTIRNGNGEFHVEFTGNPDNSYYIKAVGVPENNMYVSQGPRSNILAWAEGVGPQWSITCGFCSPEEAWSFPGGKFATDCTITRTGSGLCVRESTEGLGSFIRQYSCEGGDNEKFDFLMQL